MELEIIVYLQAGAGHSTIVGTLHANNGSSIISIYSLLNVSLSCDLKQTGLASVGWQGFVRWVALLLFVRRVGNIAPMS